MAMTGCTLHIRGFPTDMEADRLTDKLQIHFLRKRNGGGEITSLTIEPAQQYAIISFEDSKVAHNVLKHYPHILEVDDKTYRLSLNFPWEESLDVNKVVKNASVTIDCRHFSSIDTNIKTLTAKFPNLNIQYKPPQMHCLLQGLYSDIHAAVGYLMEQEITFFAQEKMNEVNCKDISKPQKQLKDAKHPKVNQATKTDSSFSDTQTSKCPITKHLRPKDDSTSIVKAQKPTDQGTKVWLDEADMEAQSLIMEADVFAYLSSKCKQYICILQNHKVEVVNETSNGVTTLYLQSGEKLQNKLDAKKHIAQARKELTDLCQQLEKKLRREQIPRTALFGTKTEKDLQTSLSEVLLSFDHTNIYIVGENTGVSQAKQILLYGSADGQAEMNETSLLSSPSYSPTSESEKVHLPATNTAMLRKMNISEIKKSGRTQKEYKLAARLKNSDLSILKDYPGEKGKVRGDHGISTNMSSSSGQASSIRSSHLDLKDGEKPRHSQFGSVGVTNSHHPEDDSSCLNSLPNTASNNVKRRNSIGSPYTFFPSDNVLPHTSSNSLTGFAKKDLSSKHSTSTTNSISKEAKPFSGIESEKQEKSEINGKAQLSIHSHKRSRSNSFSFCKTPEPRPSVPASRDISVPSAMWEYMNVAYHPNLNFLISNSLMSENLTDKNEVRVVLKGSELSQVEKCHDELQNLLDTVESDLHIQRLRPTDFGLTEGDELFEECCLQVCSKFHKIVQRKELDAICIIGPKALCSQVSDKLKEIFSIKMVKHGTVLTGSNLQRSKDPDTTKALAYKVRNKSSQNQAKGDCKSPEKMTADKIQGYQSRAVIKEILRKNEIANPTSSKTDRSVSQSSGEFGLRMDTMSSQQKTNSLPLKHSSVTIHDNLKLCLCGAKGADVKQTRCGMCFCSKCFFIHAHCKTCFNVMEAKEQSKEMLLHSVNKDQLTVITGKGGRRKAEGIQGTMAIQELSQSLPGNDLYTTAQIKYYIYDGIQGEEHPSPGSPFQGGWFIAYLPLSSEGQSLLNCLKKAFEQGLTFTVCPKDKHSLAKVIWNKIPHKTEINGGKSGNGYPDSTYLKELSDALKACGLKMT